MIKNLSAGSGFDMATGAVAPELKKMRVMIQNFCRIQDGSLLPEIDLRRYGMEVGETVTNTLVQELCSMHQKILSLSLLNCDQVSDVGLWAIAKFCVYIRKLNCSGCSLITTVGIRSLSLRCAELVELDLSNCRLLDDMALTVLAGGSWRIQRLSLLNCEKISDNGLVKIAQGLSGSLTHLNINGCPCIGEFGDRGVKELGNHCRRLRELLIDSAKRLEDAGVTALAKGCSELETLMLSGGENLSKKGLRALAENMHKLRHLKLVQNRRLSDLDYQVLLRSPLSNALHTLEIESFESLTDKGLAIICRALAGTLRRLFLVSCHQLTDYAAVVISNFCTELRELDLRYCGRFTDEAVHYMAGKLSKLTSLKLDGNSRITTRTLLQHITRHFEFVEMANEWLGYVPKPAVEALIARKEELLIHHRQAIRIQCLVRRRFADRIYWVKQRERLLQRAIPLFQAIVRGVAQRRRFALVLWQLHRIRCAIKIQCKWRKFAATRIRMRALQKKRYAAYVQRLASLIQKMFRGMQGRRRMAARRVEMANLEVLAARRRALQEVRASLIQRVYRGHVARCIVYERSLQKDAEDTHRMLCEKSARLLQRVAFGMLGRKRMRQRRVEVALAKERWYASREVQRAYRGHLGRIIYQRKKQEARQRRRAAAAVCIQRQYRGYRGRLLAAVARALRLLRAQQQFATREIQRFLRGCMGRHYFAIHKEIVTREKRRAAAAVHLQRLFRGHKGREAKEVEEALQRLEFQAKPLFLHLRQLEIDAAKARKVVARLAHTEQMMAENLVEIERELEHCHKTTNKYTDSVRINSTPQRFLTKFLQVRLQDLLDHEEVNTVAYKYNRDSGFVPFATCFLSIQAICLMICIFAVAATEFLMLCLMQEVHRVKHIELKKRRADLRDLDRDILLTQRELVPLTTGLIANVKRERTVRLRALIWRRRKSAVAIQAVWRRALVRSALYDPHFESWVQRMDRTQSDQPYYFNTASRQIVWKKPLAYRYFGERSVSVMDAMQNYAATGHGTR